MRKLLLLTAVVMAAISTISAAGAQSFRPETIALLKHFVAEKEAQATAAANTNTPMIPEYRSLFAAARQGDWPAVSNIFCALRLRAPQFSDGGGQRDFHLTGTPWHAVLETWGVMDAFSDDETYSTRFGRDIIDSIPPHSIYFGGTDSGRFVITAMCGSHTNADPFFTLTQNALIDGSYLNYLRAMYGARVYVPTLADSQKCYQNYMTDAQQRLAQHQLKPGENVELKDGRVQVSGQVAVMSINGLLAKIVFDKNPDREFYIEESFPLDWMYPYLEPHRLIMKLNRQPLPVLSEAAVQKDCNYWSAYIKPMIGDWLHADTPVSEVCAFAQRTYVRQDLKGFKGDPGFVQTEDAHRLFSKLRSCIGGLYTWRISHATDPAEQKRMSEAADFAFRQAFALCPDSPEATFRYVQLLVNQKRMADALLIAETDATMPAMLGHDGDQVRDLVENLKPANAGK